MNVLEKILEEIKQYTEDVYECDLDDIVEYQRRNREDNCTYIVQGIEEATGFIRSHMDEVPNCGECNRRKWYQIGYEDGKKDDGWIPVEERLPEEDERYKGRKAIDVLVTTSNGRVTKVQRQSKYDYWCWGRIYGEPTAWQPLPKPYKEES